MVPSLIKLINFDKFFEEIGLSVISIFFSFNNANNSPVIQFVANFTSEFFETLQNILIFQCLKLVYLLHKVIV